MCRLDVSYSAAASTHRTARHRIEQFLDSQDIHDPNLLIAVGEALSNAWLHACCERPGTIKVAVDCLPDRIIVEVSDPGPGFDTAIPYHNSGIPGIYTCGRYLMASCVDHVSYYHNGRWFVCRLVKSLKNLLKTPQNG